MNKYELIKHNQKLYAEVEAEIETMDGIQRAVAENLTLAWIKGNKWLGGLNDSKAAAAYEKLENLGYSFRELFDEFNRQTEKYIER